MMTKGLWKEDTKAFGLPKIKAVRIKIKKEKAAEKTAEEAAAAAPAATSAADQKAKAAPKK